jgi:hypothetical protein
MNTEHKQPEPLLEAKNTKSKGEKTFDRAVYVGMAGVGTFVATLGLAFMLKHGGWAGPRYQRAVEWTQRNLGRFLSPQTSEKVAEEAVMTTALMMGGNAMILPIGAAEHYKVPIVSGLNVMMGDKTPPEAIEQAPKQTWRSLIEGRLVAWGVVFGALMTARFAVPNSFKLFQVEVGERAHEAVQWLRGAPKLTGEAMEGTKAFRLGKIGALDVFATAAAATILYIGGHFFARKQAEKKSGNVAEAKRHGLPMMRSDAEAEPVMQAGAVTAVTGDKAHHGTLAARAVEQHLS